MSYNRDFIVHVPGPSLEGGLMGFQSFPQVLWKKTQKYNHEWTFYYILQGISLWNVSFRLTLTDKNMQVKFCLEVSVYSWGYGIWVLSTSFQKSNISWPQQPPTRKVLKSVKNWSFEDPFHKNGPVLVILMPGMIQPSESGVSLVK